MSNLVTSAVITGFLGGCALAALMADLPAWVAPFTAVVAIGWGLVTVRFGRLLHRAQQEKASNEQQAAQLRTAMNRRCVP